MVAYIPWQIVPPTQTRENSPEWWFTAARIYYLHPTRPGRRHCIEDTSAMDEKPTPLFPWGMASVALCPYRWKASLLFRRQKHTLFVQGLAQDVSRTPRTHTSLQHMSRTGAPTTRTQHWARRLLNHDICLEHLPDVNMDFAISLGNRPHSSSVLFNSSIEYLCLVSLR